MNAYSENAVDRRRWWPGSVLALGLVTALIGAAALPATVAGATVGAGTSVAHWGSFFGDGSADNDQLMSPTDVALPGPVAQVATSNSTQYALLTDGAVYAWGLGTEGELGDGATTNSFTAAGAGAVPGRRDDRLAAHRRHALQHRTGHRHVGTCLGLG